MSAARPRHALRGEVRTGKNRERNRIKIAFNSTPRKATRHSLETPRHRESNSRWNETVRGPVFGPTNTLEPKKCCAFLLSHSPSLPAFPPQRLQTEKEFITDAIKGDNSEIALGRLTVATSASDPVKAFGQTLIDDHSNAKTEVSAVATKVNVSPPGEMSSEAQTEVTKLKQLSGRDFYTEFACYMVEDHQKDIAEFKKRS